MAPLAMAAATVVIVSLGTGATAAAVNLRPCAAVHRLRFVSARIPVAPAA